MEKFNSKKLLLLGNSTSSDEIVRIAHKLGAYVIVIDNTNDSTLKEIADKSYSVNTADLDELEKLAKIEKINGVIAGASEFNIRQALLLSNRLSTPFYATKEQWDILSNKETFKSLCRQYNVPVVEEYDIDNILNSNNCDLNVYPVIIKPVDGTAGMGISICKNKDELLAGYEKALSCSSSKKVILERYMTGEEVVIYYTIQDSYVSLSAMCDRYTFMQEGVAPLPSAYIFPSKYLSEYKKYDNENVIKMFEGIGLKNGFLFLQSFIENNRVRFYEMGYRIAGAQGQNIISAVNGVDALEMLVRHSLSGKMDGWDLRTQDNADFKKYACKLTPILNLGKIKRIEGLNEIREFEWVTKVVDVNKEGDIVKERGTLKQLLTRIYLVADSIDEMKERIDIIQSKIHVYDEDDNEMIIGKFDTNNI